MTFRTITPECDFLQMPTARVETPEWLYPRVELLYDAPMVTLASPQATWEMAEVAEVQQDDQQWRFLMADGSMWSVERAPGCRCGGDTPVRRA